MHEWWRVGGVCGDFIVKNNISISKQGAGGPPFSGGNIQKFYIEGRVKVDVGKVAL